MKKWILTFGHLIIAQAISLMILFSPLKDKIHSFLFPKKNKLLSVVTGDLTGKGDFVKILKFKTRDGLQIEFLRDNPYGINQILDTKDIRHPYNGFFEYRGSAIQLGIGDVDGDGVMDILAPSFDEDLVAHLNIYSYDEKADRFYKKIHRIHQ